MSYGFRKERRFIPQSDIESTLVSVPEPCGITDFSQMQRFKNNLNGFEISLFKHKITFVLQGSSELPVD